jgi:hypothetical protein
MAPERRNVLMPDSELAVYLCLWITASGVKAVGKVVEHHHAR